MAAKRRDRAEWLELVRQWKASGLSRAAFAKRRRIRGSTLAWWAWRLRADGEDIDGKEMSPDPTELLFVEVTPTLVADSRIEIEIGEAVVRLPDGFDAEALARVLEVIGRDR